MSSVGGAVWSEERTRRLAGEGSVIGQDDAHVLPPQHGLVDHMLGHLDPRQLRRLSSGRHGRRPEGSGCLSGYVTRVTASRALQLLGAALGLPNYCRCLLSAPSATTSTPASIASGRGVIILVERQVVHGNDDHPH